jgi:hypothetical protein
MRRWAGYLARCRRAYGTAAFTAALDWYCLHAGERGVPQIECGRSFYAKWASLAGAIQRSPPAVAVTPAAEKLVKDLQAHHGYISVPAAAVQVSLDVAQRFLATATRLAAVVDRTGHRPPLAGFAHELLAAWTSPTELVRHHFAKWCQWAEARQAANLDLNRHVLTEQDLEKRGRAEAARYLDGKYWDLFMQEVGHEG